MKHKWQVRAMLPMRDVAPQRSMDDARSLQWAEIAGLIEIRPDGSWRPTAFGWEQLLKLERDPHGASLSRH